MNDVSAHYDETAASYHEQYDRSLVWDHAAYPANLFRLEKVTEILRNAGAKSLYDIGAGEASPMIEVHKKLGIQVAGCELSPEMVKFGRENLAQQGLDPNCLGLLDMRDRDALKAEAERVGQFDAVMALGVIPHVEDDNWFVEAMSLFLKPGGTLILQFRNSMFSMFTFNRLTKVFILDELLANVPKQFKDAVSADLDRRLAVDKPPARAWNKDAPSYDEILARFHNPFELADVVRANGYEDLSFRWYNFHPTYPMIAGELDPREYREAQVDLEADKSWRGMFLCSAGMIIARKSSAN